MELDPLEMAVQAVDWAPVEGLPALLGLALAVGVVMVVDAVGVAVGIPPQARQTCQIKVSTLMTEIHLKPKKLSLKKS